MDIFLTSASGQVGAAVAAALEQRGHRVAALVRSASSAARARAAGARPIDGTLAEIARHRAIVHAADAVIHTAMEYTADGTENAALDRACTEALLGALKPGARFIYTSNAYLPGVVDEAPVAAAAADPRRGWRLALERDVLDAGAHTAVLRLGMVYGRGDGGTVADLTAAAAATAPLPYLAGAGANRWSLVHLDDAAALYAAIVEAAACGIFHAVDGAPRAIAQVAGLVASLSANTAVEADEAVLRARLDAHTVDLMHRDVALAAPRAAAIGWKPAYASLDAFVAERRGGVR